MGRLITLVEDETFEFRPERFDGVIIRYRQLTGALVEEVNREFRRRDKRTGAAYFPPEREHERNLQLALTTIVAWEGVVDRQGRPVPCDDTAKTRFVAQYPDTASELIRLATSDITVEAGDGVEDPTRA